MKKPKKEQTSGCCLLGWCGPERQAQARAEVARERAKRKPKPQPPKRNGLLCGPPPCGDKCQCPPLRSGNHPARLARFATPRPNERPLK